MRPLIGITADVDAQSFKLKRDYVAAVVRSGGTPFIIAPVAGDIRPLAEMVDGLLIPGGGDLLPQYYNEQVMVPPACLEFVEKDRTDFELSLITEVSKRGKPVLGICYGMQLINTLFGGSLYQDIRHQKPGALDHKNGCHGITIRGALLRRDFRKATVNSYHHQAVKVLGSGLESFAEADDGIIEGIYHREYSFLAGVQWHPERGCRASFLLNVEGYDTLSLKILESFVDRAGKDKKNLRFFGV